MPNWCENSLYIAASEVDIAALKTAISNQAFLNYLHPEPEHAESSDNNLIPAWYDWRITNWGTKWEVQAEITGETETSLYIHFDSAWSPPISALRHWIGQSDGHIVNLRYIEWGMAFCGIFNNEENVSYSIPETASEVVISIPAELDAQFDIAQTVESWEVETLEANKL